LAIIFNLRQNLDIFSSTIIEKTVRSLIVYSLLTGNTISFKINKPEGSSSWTEIIHRIWGLTVGFYRQAVLKGEVNVFINSETDFNLSQVILSFLSTADNNEIFSGNTDNT
jgi:hypothetical protein